MKGLSNEINIINETYLNPLGLNLITVYDETIYINTISLVKQNILIGAIFAICVLMIFLKF